jgi:hypothetical protein
MTKLGNITTDNQALPITLEILEIIYDYMEDDYEQEMGLFV